MNKSDNSEEYNKINRDEHLYVSSYMGIVPENPSFELSKDYLYTKIDANSEFKIETFEEKDFDEIHAYEISIDYEGSVISVLIYQRPLNYLNLDQFSFSNGVKKTEYESAKLRTSYIEVSVIFSKFILESYLFQLKVLDTIIPNACIGLDLSSGSIFSIPWMKMIIAANIPPDHSYLYSIKTTYLDTNNERTYWLRTEGLLRCSAPELELVNIKDGEREMYDLLDVAAHLLIDCRFKENTKFQVGYDGMGMYLSWIRWENALIDFPSKMLGGFDYRKGEYLHYSHPSGILYAVEDNMLVSPEMYLPIIRKNPIFLVTSYESERKKAFAISQLNVFIKAFETFQKKTKNKKTSFWRKFLETIRRGRKTPRVKDWIFLIKLGLEIDNPKVGYSKEHLWFEVLKVDGDEMTGKLCNKPYGIKELNEGDIKSYVIRDFFSDWKIYDPVDYEYTPDSAYLLESDLKENGFYNSN